VFQTYVLNVSFAFKCMLQVLYLMFQKQIGCCIFLLAFYCLAFCCLASFSDCGGGAARTGEGGAPVASKGDAPWDCGMDASARCPLPLHWHVALQSPLVFYFTKDAEIRVDPGGCQGCSPLMSLIYALNHSYLASNHH
jgi:hypothetical protein